MSHPNLPDRPAVTLSDPSPAAPTVPDTDRLPAVGSGPGPAGRLGVWAALLVLGVLAVLVAVVGIFYLPSWAGAVPVPWSVLPVAAFAWWAPRQGHRLTGSVLGAAVPILVWFVVTVWLSLSRNSLYAGHPVAVQDWRLYLLVGVGVLVSAWGIGGIWGRATLERAKADRAALYPPAE